MAGSEQMDALKSALQRLRETKMKVAERADLMNKIHELLNMNQLRIALDQESSEEADNGEQRRAFGWRAIVKNMTELVDGERSDNEAKRPNDDMKRDSKRKSATPVYKRDCFTLWRTTIQIALANRPTNRSKNVNLAAVEKMLANLFDSDSDETFGYTSEALDVLVLVLENDGSGLNLIKADDWSELFGKCCSLVRTAVNRPTTKIKPYPAAHAVSLLASALPNSTRALSPVNVRKCCKELYSLFQLLLPMVQRERAVTPLLQALNALLTQLGVEHRNQLAELALGIAPSLVNRISLLTDDGSDKELQKLLTTFFNFIFVLHQPDCVSAPSVAVLLRSDSEHWASWKNVVKSLYEHLVAIELSRVLNRAESHQKTKKEPNLMEEQIELIARTIVVCHEFGDEISLSLPAASALMSTTLNNQTRALDTTSSGAAPFKRRLIQVGYVFLLDLIIEMATKRRFSNPCYQILSKILSRWSHRLAAEDYDSLIIGLVNSLGQLKRQEAIKWTMRTLAAALPRASVEMRLAHLWPIVLDHCLVAVRSRALQSSAATLLVEMLKCAAVPDVRHLNLARVLGEVYSMDAPTQHAVESLTALVGLVDFDEKVLWQSLSAAQRRSPLRAFRLGVVEWLLQVVDEDELNTESDWIGISALSSIPVQQLANLSAMLCVQYPECSLSNAESRSLVVAHPWSKMEQALVNAFALSNRGLSDRLSSPPPITESLPLPEVVSVVIEQFVNGSSAVRNAFKTASDSTRSKSALVRHLNLGLALSGSFNVIGCKNQDHDDLVALNREIELLTKLLLDKALTNASDPELSETLSAWGKNCANAPPLRDTLLLRLAALAAGDLHECVGEESPDENRFIRPNERKRSAPLARGIDRQWSDRGNDISTDAQQLSDTRKSKVQRAAWECLLRFHDSESNAIMIAHILEKQASTNIEPWMLESVLTTATRPLPSVVKLLFCSSICGSVRERIDALSRAKRCCSQEELLEIWSQLWSIVNGSEEATNKQRLLGCVWDVFDMNTIARCQVDGSPLTTLLLERGNSDAAQSLKLAQVASSALFTMDQLSALLRERAISEDDQTEACWPWLNSLTFFRLVASIVSDHSAVDLHPVALFRLLVSAQNLPAVWRLFVEQLIPDLTERISWHFSLISRWWIESKISLERFPLAMVGCSSEDAFFGRFSNELMGSIVGASDGDQNAKWAQTRMSAKAVKVQNAVGLRQAAALLFAADEEEDDEKALRDFVEDAKNNRDGLGKIWPKIVFDLIKWQCASPIQAPQMSAKSVKEAINRLLAEINKASLTMALNDGSGIQKNERDRNALAIGDCLLVICAELRTIVLNSCGQFSNALHAFRSFLFELDLKLLNRQYVPFLAREAWWTCAVCIRRSVRDKRQQNYVALLVRLWAEISERLLASGRSAFDRFEFAMSSVMKLLEQQSDYPDASEAAVSYLMKWLKKLDEHLTSTAIPVPPMGPITDHLRRLIVDKRQLLVQQELSWFLTAESHLLTVGYWQYLRQLLEAVVAENSQLTVDERVTGKLLALWRRKSKWRRWLAPILALLPNDRLLLDQSLLPPTKSIESFVLDWAGRLLFATGKCANRRIFNAVRRWLQTNSIGAMFDAEVKKTGATRCLELLPFRHDNFNITAHNQSVSNEHAELCFFADEWSQPISFEFWMEKTAVGVLAETIRASERYGAHDPMLLRSFEEFIALNTEFAQALLPLACEILLSSQETYRAQLAGQFNSILSAMKCAAKVEEEAKLSIALTLLEILRHLSSDGCRLKSTKLLSLPAIIPLDFALLADVLAAVRLPHAALFYAEIACDERSESIRATQLFDEAGRSLLDSINPTNDGLRRTMKTAVMQLGDVDSLKGLGQIAFVDDDARCFLAERSHAWERMVSLYSRADSPAKFAKALRMLGVDDDRAPLAVQYENAWKLGRWEQLSVPKKEGSLDGRLFGVLNAVREGNDSLTDRLVRDLLQSNMDQICQRNVPDAFHLRWHRSIGDLQQLALNAQTDENVPEMCRAIDKSLRVVDAGRTSTTADAAGDEFAMETSLLLAKLAATADVPLKELTFNTLSNMVTARARALRKSQAYQQAIRLVGEWHTLVAVHSDVRLSSAFRLQPALEAASSLWKSDDLVLAKNQVESIIDELTPKLTQRPTNAGAVANEKLLQVVSKSYALLAKLQSCNGGDQDAALKEACAVLERANVSKGNLATMLSKMNWRLGKYTEAKYRTLRAYRDSPEFKAKETAVENWKHQMTALTDRLLLHRLRSECRLEKMDIESSDNVLRSLLMETVRRYLTAIRMGDAHDLCMYLLIDLWMDNRDDVQLCALMQEQGSLIASHKWLLVWNQLSSRVAPLEDDCAQLRSVIETLLTRVAHDHPYHTINSLLYISEVATADAKSLSHDKNRIDRINSTKKILSELKKSDRARVVKDMYDAHQAFRQITDAPFSLFKESRQSNSKGMLDIPANMTILKVAALKNLPIPTLTIPVDKSFKYSDVIRFGEVRPYCSKADGRSMPKVLRVLGSDGVERRIIFKSGDDLRQDILVEQVFAVANSLLTSAKRPGCMRTYNVVPLSHGAGLIEWCEHTMSLCNYLVGANKASGAHARYHPSDITGSTGLLRMKKAADEADRRAEEAKLTDKRAGSRRPSHDHSDPSQVFRSLCQQFHPVFRHFFFERFADPTEWCRRRNDYTVNVATWSMVCHLVGLGDRHLNNILIDERTAELVHIDLGMAFEFSRRALRVPEMVPFRLTRDMVDPMGAWGVDGLFTATCTRTMTVMRANKSVLLAVVSILLHDPVASFQEMPVKKDDKPFFVSKSQPPIVNRNSLAETAIARMTEKLSGRETIDKVEMTVDRQVAYLIDEARSPDNLSRMYYGWMPFV